MRYMLLIYWNQADRANMTEAEGAAEMAAYNAYNTLVQERGVMLSGEALYPVTAATSVRVRDGKTVTMDGPFAETKEQLGGYYILNCKDLDEAIELAAKIPGVPHGTIVEIRPIVEL